MKTNLQACVLMAACAAAAIPAAAQNVYRCGDSYSQKPCAGGAVVPTDDARSAAQRAQTREAAQRDGKTADAMEKARLKDEAKATQAYIPEPMLEPAVEEKKPDPAVKPKKPQYFTAAAPRKPGEADRRKRRKRRTTQRPRPRRSRPAPSLCSGRRRLRLRGQAPVLLPKCLAVFHVLRVDGDARYRANLHALRLVEVPHAFGTTRGVDLVDLLAQVDRLVGTFGLADIAVDALVGDHQSHAGAPRAGSLLRIVLALSAAS
jgi:hypothetical protein